MLAHRADGRDAQGASCRGERRQNRNDGADQGTDNHRGDRVGDHDGRDHASHQHADREGQQCTDEGEHHAHGNGFDE